MSVPPELRILCLRISSTSAEQLPRITPALIRDVLKCQEVLSFQTAATKAENSETAVLIHKLKTQVSGLLYGKSAEGRFTAAALIKAIVDVGGATILSGVEPWVRGLLAVLGVSEVVDKANQSLMWSTEVGPSCYQEIMCFDSHGYLFEDPTVSDLHARNHHAELANFCVFLLELDLLQIGR